MANERLKGRRRLLGPFGEALRQMIGREYVLAPVAPRERWSPLFIEVVGE